MRIKTLVFAAFTLLLLKAVANADWRSTTWEGRDPIKYELQRVDNGMRISHTKKYEEGSFTTVQEVIIPFSRVKEVHAWDGRNGLWWVIISLDGDSKIEKRYSRSNGANSTERDRWGTIDDSPKYDNQADADELVRQFKQTQAQPPPPRVAVRPPSPPTPPRTPPPPPPPPVVAPEPKREFDSLHTLISNLDQISTVPVRLGDLAQAEPPETPGNTRDLVGQLRAARRPMLADEEVERRFRELQKQRDMDKKPKPPDEETGEWSTISGRVTCWGNDRIWIEADVLMFIVNDRGDAHPKGPYIEVKNSTKMPITVTGDFMARNMILQPGETGREMANVGYGHKPQGGPAVFPNVVVGVTVKYWKPKKK